MSIPTGTVTFLFTDIEGSTRLWDQQPDAMSAALIRHDLLMHQAITTHQGVVFKTMGDGFCAAFSTAPDALVAALTVQSTLQSEIWPEAIPLQVRIALHTGIAEERDGDYFGPPLNRVARLLDAGHGGQILLSLATYELTRDLLPVGSGLKVLGSHVLRDLARPEQIYQLLHPDLPAQFPPLKSLDNPGMPNNLPQQVSSFVGREKELSQIKTLLGSTRLLTLTGSGGAGKTRLSLQTAADLLEDYPDGVWFIELAPITDPLLVPQAVAGVFGIKEQPGQTLTQALVEWLKPKNILLILDNCEHLLAASAALVTDVLSHCAHVTMLASSREGLNIVGEQTYRVPSLSLPDPKETPTIQNVSQYEAVQLFIERVSLVKPGFAVTNANAPAVASICYRLDGIPLALELAAARIRSLSVEEIHDRLDNRFRLLTGGSRTALPRQQTLRALIDWSYDLLTAQEKSVLCRLSVFTGGWLLPAAESVCLGDDIEDWEVFDLLTSLADKSLVSLEETDGLTRYRYLETVRQYARDRLAESGDSDRIRDKHAAYFLTLAETAAPQLLGPDQSLWLTRLETEHDNLRSALAWYAEMQDEAGAMASMRMAGALHRFWYVRGYLEEARRCFREILAAPGAQGQTLVRAKALNQAGIFAFLRGDPDQAKLWFEESLGIAQHIGDKTACASTLNSLGNMANVQGDYTAASSRYEECLEAFRELGEKTGISQTLNNLGILARNQGDNVRARLLFEESLMIVREIGHQGQIAQILDNLGSITTNQGDFDQATVLYEESLAIRRELGDKRGIANVLYSLGVNANNLGDHDQAVSLYEESLAIQQELGDRDGSADALLGLSEIAIIQGHHAQARMQLVECLTIRYELGDRRSLTHSLDGMAHLAIVQAHFTRAACLWGASEALREAIGSSLEITERAEYDSRIASARNALGDEAFTSAWNQGRALTWEQTAEYALSEPESDPE